MGDEELLQILRTMLYSFVPIDVYSRIASSTRVNRLFMLIPPSGRYGFFTDDPEVIYGCIEKNPTTLQIFREPDRVLEAISALAMERKMRRL